MAQAECEAQNDLSQFNIETVSSGFFLITALSEATIKSSSISNTYGNIGSAVFVQLGCSLTLTNSTLKNIGLANKTGNVIFAEKAKQLNVKDSIFDRNYNKYIVSDGTPTVIMNSNFTNGSGMSFVEIKESSLKVQDSIFLNNKNMEGSGLAIQCNSCTEADITSSAFKNFTGSAIDLQTSKNVLLDSLKFENNTAKKGPAVYIYDSNVKLKEGIFLSSNTQDAYNTSDFNGNAV